MARYQKYHPGNFKPDLGKFGPSKPRFPDVDIYENILIDVDIPGNPEIAEIAHYSLLPYCPFIATFDRMLRNYIAVQRFLVECPESIDSKPVYKGQPKRTRCIQDWLKKNPDPPRIFKKLGPLSIYIGQCQQRLEFPLHLCSIEGKKSIILDADKMKDISKRIAPRRDIDLLSQIHSELCKLATTMEECWSPARHIRLLQFCTECIIYFKLPSERQLSSQSTAKKLQLERTAMRYAFNFLCENDMFLFAQDNAIESKSFTQYPIDEFIDGLSNRLTSRTGCAKDIHDYFAEALKDYDATSISIYPFVQEKKKLSIYDTPLKKERLHQIKKRRNPSRGEVKQKDAALLCGRSIGTIKNWEGTNGRKAKAPDGYPGRANRALFMHWLENVYFKLPGNAIRGVHTARHTHVPAKPSLDRIQYHGDLSNW